MRRSEKAVTAEADLEAILQAGKICQLAIPAEPAPYLVSLNFGYRDKALYFHSAPVGRKIELLRANPLVAFTVAIDLGLVRGERACNWSNRFRSVVGRGRIVFLEEADRKREGLDRIMAQYSDEGFSYPDEILTKTLVYKLVIEEMTGKQSWVD